MSSRFRMDPQSRLSGHLWSVAILAAALVTALVVDRLAASSGPLTRSGGGAVGEIAGFMTPLAFEGAQQPSPDALLPVDPFGGERGGRAPSIARGASTPTVTSGTVRSLTGGRRLSAILIADDKPVAVIDDQIVRIGDVLPDGGLVTAIRSDRVSILERNGSLRVLNLFSERP